MDRTAINSSAFNGPSGLALVLATASILCSAEVTVAGARQWDALAPAVYAQATITATATNTVSPTVQVAGAGELYGNPVTLAFGQVQAGGTANILAYVLQNVSSSAAINCSASVQAIVASNLGSSNIAATATVSPTATKIHPGYSGPSATGSVTLTGTPLVTRYTPVAISGTGNLRAETRINGVQESYSAPTGTANITADAAAWTMQGANLLCMAEVVPTITTIQAAAAQSYANGMLVFADVLILQIPTTSIDGTASVSAAATYVWSASSTVSGTANLTMAKTYQAHAAACNQVLGTAAMTANGIVTRFGSAQLVSTATVVSTAIRNVVPTAEGSSTAIVVTDPTAMRMSQSDIAGTASVNPVAERFALPTASIAAAAEMTASADLIQLPQVYSIPGSAEVTATAIRIALGSSDIAASANIPDVDSLMTRYAIANVDDPLAIVNRCIPTVTQTATSQLMFGAAAIQANLSAIANAGAIIDTAATLQLAEPNIVRYALANLDGAAEIGADPVKLAMGYADILGVATLYVDTIANPESYDPDVRTLKSPARLVEFSRPFVETEFRRAA